MYARRSAPLVRRVCTDAVGGAYGRRMVACDMTHIMNHVHAHLVGLERASRNLNCTGTPNVKALLSLALKGLCEREEELPIIVVEVDNRCTPGQLRSLLILMKQYGADQHNIFMSTTVSSYS